MLRHSLIIAFVLALCAPAGAIDFRDAVNTDWVFYNFGCVRETCVIQDNSGGVIEEFEWAAKQALDQGVRIVIDGTCDSACVVFASRARENVCLTKNARMGIHVGYTSRIFDRSGKAINLDTEYGHQIFDDLPKGYREVGHYQAVDYGKDINRWANAHGKMPRSRIKPYTMKRKEALMFWKPCA